MFCSAIMRLFIVDYKSADTDANSVHSFLFLSLEENIRVH